MAKQDLYCGQGTDFSTSLIMSADDGTAINITGYVFEGVIRKNIYSDSPSANLMITTPDNANGNVVISLDRANTANLEQGLYQYTVQFTNTANITAVLLDGLFIVKPNVILAQPLNS